MATAASSALECPVCHDGFSEPKLLPCAHVVCRKCVLEWLEKGGDQNGCPLCRAPILPDSVKGQGDLSYQVDTLPTDLATAVLVDIENTLSGDHVCSCCEVATLFCLQCAMKICSSCAKTHAKIPTTRDHVTEKLSDLSVEQLATHQHTPCVKHSDKQAELYCSDHDELICVLCVLTHCQCSDVKVIGEAATGKREELRVLVQRLVDREAAVTAKVSQLSKEMTDAQAEFKAMRDKVAATFDDMQTSLEARRQKLLAEIQGREHSYLAERKSSVLDLENLQAALSANRSTGERLVSSAADSPLLGMLGKLKARLEALESQALPDPPRSTPGTLLLRAATVENTKKAVAAIGALKDTETEDDRSDGRCLWCDRDEWRGSNVTEGTQKSVAAKKQQQKPPVCLTKGSTGLEGPQFAAVIKVGDRVRRGRDWPRYRGNQDGSPPGVGRVTDVAPPCCPGWVKVHWDCGHKDTYRMGAYNSYAPCYELKLVVDQ